MNGRVTAQAYSQGYAGPGVIENNDAGQRNQIGHGASS